MICMILFLRQVIEDINRRCPQIILKAWLCNSTNYGGFLTESKELRHKRTTDAIFANSYPSKNGHWGHPSEGKMGNIPREAASYH